MKTCTDSHAHLTGEAVFDHVEAILARAQAAGVGRIINICTTAQELERGVILSQRYPWVYNAASTTPHDVDRLGETEFPFFASQARAGHLIAIGETGLDYHYTHSNPASQKKFLERYFQLALECRLPVVIHCREAFADFFEILDHMYVVDGKHAPGVLHCFTGTLSEAHQVIERGWYLSLSGIVTFKKSIELQEVAKIVPLDRLLIETDTPYLAPQSHRGKPNEPAFVLETAACIAKLRGVPTEEIIQSTNANASRLFS
jgi:TatD DNase family protein